MARVMFAVVVALMAVSASSAFRVINLDNGGISGEEETFVPGGIYRTNAPCNRGSLIGRLELIFLQFPEVAVKAKGILHDLNQNKSSRLTNFEVSSGAWQIDGTGAILTQLNEGSVFSFEFEVNGVTFVGNYDGLDLHDTQRCTIVSSTGCTQKIDITNRHPAVMQWGSEDNSDTVVGDNYFVGNFRDNAQHSLVNKFSIIQNAEGLVDVRGEILVPTVDFRSAVIVPFRVDDNDIAIFVSFSPSLTQYDFVLDLIYSERGDEVRREAYELSFYTGNEGKDNSRGTFSRLGVQSEVLLVLDQTWELLEQSTVSIVNLAPPA